MECKFVIGQKVVCVNSKGWVNVFGDAMDEAGPQCGEIYQITEIVADHDGVYLKFKEFESDPYARFWHGSFRPLQDETMSELRKLLAPIKREKELVS